MKTEELEALVEKATKGPCNPYVVTPQSATDDFYEPYSPWISGGFPKTVQVGRGLCIAADDMALIAAFYKHRQEIINLVKAAKETAKDYNNGSYLESSAANLADALAAFEEKK